MSRTKWYAKPLCVVMTLALVLGVSLTPAVPASAADGDGTATISPSGDVVAGSTGNWTITYTVPTDNMTLEGGIEVTIPAGWTTPQTANATAAGYVTASCNTTGGGNVTASIILPMVIKVTLGADNLTADDTIDVVYGDTSGGTNLDAVATAQTNAQTDVEFTVDEDLNGLGQFAAISAPPSLNVIHAAAASLGVTGITDPIIRGTASNVKVTAYDDYENVATSYNGTIIFTSSDTAATLPSNYTFNPATDNGTRTFIDGVTFNTVGEQSVTATDTVASSITGTQSDIYVYVIKVVTKKYYIETNLFGTEAWFHIGSNGEILKMIEATSQDGNLTITIPEGTIALNEDDDPLEELEAAVDKSPPDPPEDAGIIGLAYDFGPDGATFDPPITLEVTYEPAEVPEGVAEEDLVVSWYDHETGKWEECEYTCDPETHCITACVCHFTTFAIIARAAPPPLAPAPVPAPAPPEVVAPAPLEPPAPPVAPVPPPEPPPEPEPSAKPAVNWPVIGGAIVAVVIVGVLTYFLVFKRKAE